MSKLQAMKRSGQQYGGDRQLIVKEKGNRPASPQKRVLVLSSTEGLNFARAVKDTIESESKHAIQATVWDRTEATNWLLDHVTQMIRRFPFVVILMTPDDKRRVRGKLEHAPRDNLVLELGLALAINDVSRTFLMCSKNAPLGLPSDIEGLHYWEYEGPGAHGPLEAVMQPCLEIIGHIHKLHSVMSWDLLFEEIIRLSARIHASPHHPEQGFRPDIVVGVNVGGYVSGGLLYYLNRNSWHFMTVWTKHESPYRTLKERQEDFRKELAATVSRVRKEKSGSPRILLVDDSDKSGEAMQQAIKLVRSVAPDATVEAAAVVYLGPTKRKPKFVGQFQFEYFKYAPV